MSLLLELIRSTDLENASKQDLRNLIKRIRLFSKFNAPAIDLRTADEIELRQYLEDIVAAHTEKAEIVASVEPEAIAPQEAEVTVETEPSTPLPMKSPVSFNTRTMNAIELLLEKAPDGLVTTEWLSGILHDCMWRATKHEKISEKLLLNPVIYYGLAGLDISDVSLFKRAVSCPGEFAELTADAKEGAEHYQKIGGLLGNDAMGEMVIYHTIRDNLNYLQSLMSISSLRTRNYAIRDKLFTRQDYDYQMILLPSDRTVLKAEVIRVTEYFRRITTEYDKYREMSDESLEPLCDIDIMALAAEAEHCWLTDESWEWNEAKTSGKFAHKVDPDSIHLSFCRWDTSVNDFSPFFTVVATHPDPSRFPWKEQQQD